MFWVFSISPIELHELFASDFLVFTKQTYGNHKILIISQNFDGYDEAMDKLKCQISLKVT